MKQEFLYIKIADAIAEQIKSGALLSGSKLPSIRQLSRTYQISINTAKRVYEELDAQSLVDVKAQSGYYVSYLQTFDLPLPATSQPLFIANDKEPDELLTKVYTNLGREDLTLFSIGVPSSNLLPLAQLKKEIILATSELSNGGVEYDSLLGNHKFRKNIAQRSQLWAGHLHEDDIITTNGGMNALFLCLMAVAKPGDTIAVESPCYPGVYQLAISLGLKVLELPTHPTIGIEIDALKKALHMVDACLLVPNFSAPLGSCMPDENKEEVAKLLAQHNIPLIEDDVFGDLYFGGHRPKSCKSFDKEGNILYCSSISKTLAPGYRVGWISAGKYKDKILKLKLVHSISSTPLIQEVVGSFMQSGKYEKHLRQLRWVLQNNYHNYVNTIAQHFPEGTKTGRPQGGLSLWVEFDKHIDTIALYNKALKLNISIAPGRMFTLQDQFKNCMRLCIGLPWDENLELKLRQLGQLAKKM